MAESGIESAAVIDTDNNVSAVDGVAEKDLIVQPGSPDEKVVVVEDDNIAIARDEPQDEPQLKITDREEVSTSCAEEVVDPAAGATVEANTLMGATNLEENKSLMVEGVIAVAGACLLDSIDDGVASDQSGDDDDERSSSDSARPCSPERNGYETYSSLPLKEEGEMGAKLTNELDTPKSQEIDNPEQGDSASSVILSDAGESKCTSTAPVINLTTSGVDAQDEKLLALGVFAKAATEDGPTANNEDPVSKDGEPSIVSVGAGPALSVKENEASDMASRLLGRISPMVSPIETVPEREDSDASRPKSPTANSTHTTGSGYFSERLRQRLAKRNQVHAAPGSPTKSPEGSLSPSARDNSRDRLQWESRLRAASRQKRQSKSRAKSEPNERANSDILSRYSNEVEDTEEQKLYPDTVTFDCEEDEETTARLVNTKVASRDRRLAYRKCVSEVGASLSISTRAARSKLSKHHHSHHHGIGILQADGIVYDDALLLRLARQARYGRLRGEMSNATASDTSESTAVEPPSRYNEVKIHVYDLLTKDALVEMPYLNCNFPIGQCFKVVNDGCHVLGTGAYHVGVEVNGIEYAFGANTIIGLSGIFTCVAKESPGYEYRETLDFGKLYTTKRTWIRIPKDGQGASFKTMSAALGGSIGCDEKKNSDEETTPSNPNREYSFREIESFADGHAMIHSMAREYMGTDYDLLRKNCCTFARDVCMRLGVREEDIPTWFHNAAQTGADAEDVITNAEQSMKNMISCVGGTDPLDMECYNHGYEVSLSDKGLLKVFESPTMRPPRERRPIFDVDASTPDETASWTY